MVSTGAGNRKRISLMAPHVSCQRAGAGWGFSRACLIVLGFFSDAADSDNGVRTGGRLAAFPFPFPIGILVASPGKSSSPPPQDAVPSVLTISTLTRFELHTGDANGQIWSES